MKPENKYPWKEETGRLKEKEVNKPITLEEYSYLTSNSDDIKQIMEIGRTAQFSKENKEIAPEEQEKITKNILEKALELSNENLEKTTDLESLKIFNLSVEILESDLIITPKEKKEFKDKSFLKREEILSKLINEASLQDLIDLENTLYLTLDQHSPKYREYKRKINKRVYDVLTKMVEETSDIKSLLKIKNLTLDTLWDEESVKISERISEIILPLCLQLIKDTDDPLKLEKLKKDAEALLEGKFEGEFELPKSVIIIDEIKNIRSWAELEEATTSLEDILDKAKKYHGGKDIDNEDLKLITSLIQKETEKRLLDDPSMETARWAVDKGILLESSYDLIEKEIQRQNAIEDIKYRIGSSIGYKTIPNLLKRLAEGKKTILGYQKEGVITERDLYFYLTKVNKDKKSLLDDFAETIESEYRSMEDSLFYLDTIKKLEQKGLLSFIEYGNLIDFVEKSRLKNIDKKKTAIENRVSSILMASSDIDSAVREIEKLQLLKILTDDEAKELLGKVEVQKESANKFSEYASSLRNSKTRKEALKILAEAKNNLLIKEKIYSRLESYFHDKLSELEKEVITSDALEIIEIAIKEKLPSPSVQEVVTEDIKEKPLAEYKNISENQAADLVNETLKTLGISERYMQADKKYDGYGYDHDLSSAIKQISDSNLKKKTVKEVINIFIENGDTLRAIYLLARLKAPKLGLDEFKPELIEKTYDELSNSEELSQLLQAFTLAKDIEDVRKSV